MKWQIDFTETPGVAVCNVVVKLYDIAPEEVVLYGQKNMHTLTVCRHQIGPPDTFDKFFAFASGYVSVWPKGNPYQADQFAAQVDHGLQEIVRFFARNRATYKPYPRLPDPDIMFDLSLIPSGLWPEHCNILGEPGGGKTQLLQTLILHLAQQGVGFVVIDSQNQMVPLLKQKFRHAIHVDPSAAHPLSLNIFDVPVDPSTIGKVIDTFRYMFEAGDEPLSGPMATVFDKAVALMLTGYRAAYKQAASIEDFEDLFLGVYDAKKDKRLSKRAHKAVMTLPPGQQRWYLTEYPKFDIQCTSIHQRLQNICGEYKPFRRLLSNTAKPLNFRHAIDNGGMLLINTNADYLGKQASAFMGRYFINLISQQMGHRSINSRRVFFIVDEVHQYFDDNIQSLLDEARKRNVCCIFAHQRISQLTSPKLKHALTNVAILMGTNFGRSEGSAMMDLFNVKNLDFIREQQRDKQTNPTSAKYALLTRGRDDPISFLLPFYQLEHEPDAPSEHEHTDAEEPMAAHISDEDAPDER